MAGYYCETYAGEVPDLSGWGFDDDKNLNAFVARAAQVALNTSLKDMLGVCVMGTDIAVVLCFDEADDDDFQPNWRMPIVNAADWWIGDLFKDAPISDVSHETVAALRELADKIEAALND